MGNTFRTDNILIVAKDDKKKGDGYNSILSLLKDLSTFQTSVGDCMSQQTDPSNQQKVEEFYKYLDQMSESLLNMARDSLRASRHQNAEIMGQDDMISKEPERSPMPEVSSRPSSVKPPMAPSSPIGR